VHAGDTTAHRNKSPDFSTLSEFLVGTTESGSRPPPNFNLVRQHFGVLRDVIAARHGALAVDHLKFGRRSR